MDLNKYWFIDDSDLRRLYKTDSFNKPLIETGKEILKIDLTRKYILYFHQLPKYGSHIHKDEYWLDDIFEPNFFKMLIDKGLVKDNKMNASLPYAYIENKKVTFFGLKKESLDYIIDKKFINNQRTKKTLKLNNKSKLTFINITS